MSRCRCWPVLQVVAVRRRDVEGKAGNGVGADDRAVYIKMQHIVAADTATGAPHAVTIPLSNDQVRHTCGTDCSSWRC